MADRDPSFSKPDDEGEVWAEGRLGGSQRVPTPPSPVRNAVVGLLAGLLPWVVFIGYTQRTVENGLVTSYHYLNFAAIVGGLVALVCGWRLVKISTSVLATTLVFALTLLGIFQVVRGAGVFPYITDCESERYADVCTYTGE